MKEKILTLIIGVLIGAIVASAGFVIYIKTSNTGKKHDFGGPPQMHQMQGSSENRGTPPEMPNGEKPDSNGNAGDAANANNGTPASTQNSEQAKSNT